MEENRIPRKIFTQELVRARRRRRHWKEEIERDLQVMGMRDGESWR
jgi:hypothetical protein